MRRPAPRHALLTALLAGLLCALAAPAAHAAKVPYGFFPVEGTPNPGSEGEQFNGIGGIAVNSTGAGGVTPGDLYIVDRGNNRVQQLHAKEDEEGSRFVRAFGLDVGGAGVHVCETAASCQAGTASGEASGMSSPQGIAIDQQTGNVYVTDQGNMRIDVFGADGVFQGAFGWGVDTGAGAFEFCTVVSTCQAGIPGGGAGQLGALVGHPAVAPQGAPMQGNILVADSTNRRVDEFSVTLGLSGEVTGAAFVRGFGWNVNASMPAAELQTCTTATGCQQGSAGGNLGQFTNNGLTRVAVDGSGFIYALNYPTSVLCNSGGNHCHVQRFNSTATLVEEFAPAHLDFTGGTKRPQAASEIAVDPVSADVFAARPDNTGSPSNYEILRFSSGGSLSETVPTGIESFSSGPTSVEPVFGLGVDYLSEVKPLYVSSNSGGPDRVYIFQDPPSVSPTVSTGPSSEGPEFYLRSLKGAVNPEGFKLTECRFEYGTTVDYGESVACTPTAAEFGEGTTPKDVETTTEPLDPETTYHYRLVAENGSPQPGVGEDRSFTTGPAPLDECANKNRRKEQGIDALSLPGCMVLEMVSPPEKGGQVARNPNVSIDGGRVSFKSIAALGGSTGVLNAKGDTYVASRRDHSWATTKTVPPLPMIRGWQGGFATPQSFNPDFSTWLQIGATGMQYQQGEGLAIENGLSGPLSELSPLLAPVSPGERSVLIGNYFRGASGDHSHLLFRPGGFATSAAMRTVYFPGDPSGNVGASQDHNTYVAARDSSGQLSLRLLQRDRDGKAWGGECSARLGGIGPLNEAAPKNGERNQGAVSADGTRTYLSARSSQPATGACEPAVHKLRIMQRTETASGPIIEALFASECSRPPAEPCSSANGDDLYQGASQDGAKVYFTTNRQLVDTDKDGGATECSLTTAVAGCDLYLYDAEKPAGERLTQVSAGENVGVHEIGKEAKVLNGITGISGDGSHAYFVAHGVLTADDNPEGDLAQEGQPNLYLWKAESETLEFIGTLVAGDAPTDADGTNGLWGGQGTWRNQAYPVPALGDGHILAFGSKASLSEADADEGRLDIYRYDSAAEELLCVSCVGGEDNAPFDVANHGALGPAGTDYAEEARWVSEDGQTIAFATEQPLFPYDLDGETDFHIWRGGEVFRLPGKAFSPRATDSNGPFLSHDGDTIAFQTVSQLLPQDGDTVPDIYVARELGGYPFPESEEPCVPPDCQAPEAQPVPPNPASGHVQGENPTPRQPCGIAARKAQKLSKRAKRLRRNARKVNGQKRARTMRRKANGLAKQARKKSNNAKRCRSANRRAGK